MSQYEIWDLFFSGSGILIFGFLSFKLQNIYSDKGKIKELVELQLSTLLEEIEKIEYKEDCREVYLSSKRKVSNIFSNLSQGSITKYVNQDKINLLIINFEKLSNSLESNEKESIKYKETLYSAIIKIKYSLYGLE